MEKKTNLQNKKGKLTNMDERQAFPQEIQDETMQRQAYRCQKCHAKLDSVKREHFDFVHID